MDPILIIALILVVMVLGTIGSPAAEREPQIVIQVQPQEAVADGGGCGLIVVGLVIGVVLLALMAK